MAKHCHFSGLRLKEMTQIHESLHPPREMHGLYLKPNLAPFLYPREMHGHHFEGRGTIHITCVTVAHVCNKNKHIEYCVDFHESYKVIPMNLEISPYTKQI